MRFAAASLSRDTLCSGLFTVGRVLATGGSKRKAFRPEAVTRQELHLVDCVFNRRSADEMQVLRLLAGVKEAPGDL